MRAMIPYAAVIAAMLLVPQAASAGEQFPRVLVTISPLVSYVDAIVHGAGEAQSLLRPGQNPHSFALSPSQAQMLDKAEILVVPDLAMNPILARLLAKKSSIHVIELSKLDGANPLPYTTENPWVSAVKEAGNEKDDDAKEKDSDFATGNKWAKEKHPAAVASPTVDPHFWLDPERMAAIARPLADAIAESSPSNKAMLQANADLLAAHLRQEVIPAMQALLVPKEAPFNVSNKPQIPFITYHAAYQYFLGRFHLANNGELMVRPEDYVGAKSLDALLSSAKKVQIRCIIGESETTLVKRIASLSGARVVILSPEQNVEKKDTPPFPWIQNDYDRLLYKTAQSFGECLQIAP